MLYSTRSWRAFFNSGKNFGPEKLFYTHKLITKNSGFDSFESKGILLFFKIKKHIGLVNVARKNNLQSVEKECEEYYSGPKVLRVL